MTQGRKRALYTTVIVIALAVAAFIGGVAGRATAPQQPTVAANATASQLEGLCAHFIQGQEDIPDGSRLQPGSHQTKWWGVVNCGDKPWNNEVIELSFFAGPIVGSASRGPSPFSVPVVQPGQSGKISVPFTTPSLPGTYT